MWLSGVALFLTFTTDKLISGFICFAVIRLFFFLFKKDKLPFRKHVQTAQLVFAFACLIDFFIYTVPVSYELIRTVYRGNEHEQFSIYNRAFGPYWLSYWIMFLSHYLGFALSQLMWFKKYQNKNWVIFLTIIFISSTSLFEQLIIIITSLHRDFLVSTFTFLPITGSVINILQSIVYFAALVGVVQYIRTKINKSNELPI